MINETDIDTLSGATAYGSDGQKLGKIVHVYLDNQTGDPSWVTLHTGLFGTRQSFVPLTDGTMDGKDLRLPYDKDTVKGAPQGHVIVAFPLVRSSATGRSHDR